MGDRVGGAERDVRWSRWVSWTAGTVLAVLLGFWALGRLGRPVSWSAAVVVPVVVVGFVAAVAGLLRVLDLVGTTEDRVRVCAARVDRRRVARALWQGDRIDEWDRGLATAMARRGLRGVELVIVAGLLSAASQVLGGDSGRGGVVWSDVLTVVSAALVVVELWWAWRMRRFLTGPRWP